MGVLGMLHEGGAAGIAHYMADRETLIAVSTARSIQCSTAMQAAPRSRRDLATSTVNRLVAIRARRMWSSKHGTAQSVDRHLSYPRLLGAAACLYT